MRVLMVSANTETINMPVLPLGMACVAAAVEDAGHEVHSINLMAKRDVLGELKSALEAVEPDVVGLSVRNIDDQVSSAPRFLLEPVREFVRVCRRYSSAKIVLGGAGYSIFPERTLSYLEADMGIQGEGERSMVLLLRALETGIGLPDIPGLHCPQLGVSNRPCSQRDIDTFSLPRPGRQILAPAGGGSEPVWLPIQTRRGCPLRCSYCSTPTIEGTLLRKRDIQTVVDAMHGYVDAGFDRFFFVDNTFNLPAGYARRLCDTIRRTGLKIKWRGILYPRRVDESLAAAMAASGCTELSLGFESGSDEMLRRMNKRFQRSDIQRATALLQTYGIKCMGFLMFGGPGETRATVMESIEFVDALKLNAVKVTVGLRIYPCTALDDYARRTGRIRPDDDLLTPTFFVQPGMESWIRRTVADAVADRPNWIH